jgi:hypothetical protein
MAQKIPLLYENVFGRTRALARTKDTEKTVTVTLAAGKGVVVDAYAYETVNFTKILKAYPGQGIGIFVTVRNDGDSDIIWITGKDKDTGAIITTKNGTKFDVSGTLDSGKTWNFNIGTTSDPVVMPNKNFNILIEAGHGSA